MKRKEKGFWTTYNRLFTTYSCHIFCGI